MKWQQVLASADPEGVAIPVAEPGRGLDGRQGADVFQPDEQLLCAPENDHQFVSLHDDSGSSIASVDGRRDRELDLCMELDADLDVIRAAFVRMIWTLTRGVSDPARRACAST